MTYAAFLDSQNPADLEGVHVGGLRGEICPASSHDAYQDISIKAEAPSDAEAEEDPLAITFPGIKAEPEVSCVSVFRVEGFYKYKYPSYYKHSIYEFCYIEQLTFIGSKKLKHILND
jgi:hypothetical protein